MGGERSWPGSKIKVPTERRKRMVNGLETLRSPKPWMKTKGDEYYAGVAADWSTVHGNNSVHSEGSMETNN